MKNLDEFIKKITKDTDFSGMITTLDQVEKPDVISTGIDSLDKIVGVGGIPRGMLTEIYGNESTAKSSLCLKIVAQAQKSNIKCCYIDAEMAMTKELANHAQVDLSTLLVARPANGEEAFELIEAVANDGYGLIIVDSVSSLVPDDELELDFDQQSIGLQARLMSKGMRKIVGCVMRNNTAVVFINQVRDEIGKMGPGEKTTTSGGRALKFYASLRLKMVRIGWVTGPENSKLGMTVRITTAKNKLHRPQLQTDVDFMFDIGFDVYGDKLKTMIVTGELELVGRTYFSKGNKIGDYDKTIQYIKDLK